MAKREGGRLTRRAFLGGCLAAGGLLAAGGVAHRLWRDHSSRDYDTARSAEWLAGLRPAAQPEGLPNIILVSVDDLGYGDLGCYGSRAIRTPNIDSLASAGVRLTSFYAAAPLCSPSRAGLLTGRYPIRTHVTMPLYPAGAPMDVIFQVGGVYQYGVRGIPEDELLLPELLQRREYATALLGKWHLGDRSPHLPNENGFDLFYGAYYSNDEKPYAIYRNGDVAVDAPADQNVLTQNLTQEGLRFIAHSADRPFFLHYASPFPHIPLHASPAFRGRSRAGLYGDVVEELDWSIGELLRVLQELHLARRTLVIFTSDNGPWWQGSAGLARGRKNLPFEGGFKVPFVARWPGVIPAGTVSDEVSLNLDLYATCLGLAGVTLPPDRIIDGRDIQPVLKGEAPSPHETFYYYKGSRLVGVRHGKWKYLRRHMTDNGGYASLSQGPFLFDLELDPTESYSLIESRPDLARQLAGMMDDWDAEIEENPRGWL